jgi:hypothetical protein
MDVTSNARRRRLEGILVCLSGKRKRAAHSPNSNNAMRVGRVRAGSDSGFPVSNLFLHHVHQLDGGRSRAEQVNLIMQEWKWEGTSLCSALKVIWRLSPGL